MEAIRQIVTSTSKDLHITLPENLVHERLEIIILALGKSEEREEKEYRSLKGKITKDEAGRLLKHVEDSRNEW
jgi:hypothetical protein